MRGLRPDLIPVLVKKDVEKIKKEAAIVLNISGRDKNISVLKNSIPRLGVLAIIGPGRSIFGQFFDEAVLCEIGIGKSRPYHNALIPRDLKDGKTHIPARRKWFLLTQEQYIKVAPVIFEILRQNVCERVRKWKNGFDNPFYIKGKKHYWSHRQKKLFVNKQLYAVPFGTRFAVSLKDELLVRLVYWLEINKNKSLKDRLKGLARFIDKRFLNYRRNGYQRRFSTLKGAKQVKNVILGQQKLPYYLLEEMMENYLPNGRRNQLFNEIADCVGWNQEPSLERRLAESAVLVDIDVKVEVRVTTGLDKKKDHIVFQLNIPAQR